jgi:hypothetical protein
LDASLGFAPLAVGAERTFFLVARAALPQMLAKGLKIGYNGKTVKKLM